MKNRDRRMQKKIDVVVLTGLWVLFSLLAFSSVCQLPAVLIVVFFVAAVVAAAVRAVGPFRREG
jgi:hypothetical protein